MPPDLERFGPMSEELDDLYGPGFVRVAPAPVEPLTERVWTWLAAHARGAHRAGTCIQRWAGSSPQQKPTPVLAPRYPQLAESR